HAVEQYRCTAGAARSDTAHRHALRSWIRCAAAVAAKQIEARDLSENIIDLERSAGTKLIGADDLHTGWSFRQRQRRTRRRYIDSCAHHRGLQKNKQHDSRATCVDFSVSVCESSRANAEIRALGSRRGKAERSLFFGGRSATRTILLEHDSRA